MLILWAGLFQTEMIWRLSCREFGGAFADCFSLVFYLVVFLAGTNGWVFMVLNSCCYYFSPYLCSTEEGGCLLVNIMRIYILAIG
jgi:hypothetical protein